MLVGLGWAVGIYQAVHSESGRFSILLTPIGLLHPICLAGGLVILIKYQHDRSDPSSCYYRDPQKSAAIWWAPIEILGISTIVLRTALLMLLWLRVRRDFGKGLLDWVGPSATNSGLFANLTLDL